MCIRDREYATRAGTRTAYWWGSNQFDSRRANSGNKTLPPAPNFSNPFGLAHTSGNVFEWVQDCAHESYQRVPDNGAAWEAGCTVASRMLRGGCWGEWPGNLRSAMRTWAEHDSRANI